jgi:hypothetical protein
MWHLVSEPPSTCTPSAKSGSWSFYYGQDASCNYDDGFANSGLLTTPTVPDVPADATLTFWHRRNTDAGCTDTTTVEISVNGGSFGLIWEPCFQTNDQWWFTTLDLTPYYTPPNDDVQIGFRFATGDDTDNGYLGWMVDDVYIFTCPVPPPDEPSDETSPTPLTIVDSTASEIIVEEIPAATQYVIYSNPIASFQQPLGDDKYDNGAQVDGCFAPWGIYAPGEVELTYEVPDNSWVTVSAWNPSGESITGHDSGGTERNTVGTWNNTELPCSP